MNRHESMLVHERVDRRMEPFYWILTFEAMGIVIALAIAMTTGPMVLAGYYKSWWAYVLIAIGVAVGVPLMIISVKYLAKLVRKNRLLSSYRIYEDRIEAKVYSEDRRSMEETRVPLEQVEAVFASMHIMNQSYHYKKTGWKERVPQFELLPILYVVYNSGWSRRVLTIPFYGDDAVDRWLGALQQRDIPLKLINRLLQSQKEADQLDMLDSGSHVFPLQYEGSFRVTFQQFTDRQRTEDKGGVIS